MKHAWFVVLAVVIWTWGCGPDAQELATTESDSPVESSGAASGLAAAERFMTTWNTREPEIWASSLHFPHTRPSAGSHRVWETPEAYVADAAGVYEAVLATGWERTEFEDLKVIHQGDSKAHIAGRWGRVNAEGETIRRNLVTYIATNEGGSWGIQARFGAGAPLPEEQAAPIAKIALAKVEEYMEAFNARDPAAWAATLNYPHVRIAGAGVVVTDTEEEFAANMDFDAFAERFGWHHSGWDDMEAIQVAENGVNVALTFSRYDADDEVVSTFDTLYLVTYEDGRWGIRARSSFAP